MGGHEIESRVTFGANIGIVGESLITEKEREIQILREQYSRSLVEKFEKNQNDLEETKQKLDERTRLLDERNRYIQVLQEDLKRSHLTIDRSKRKLNETFVALKKAQVFANDREKILSSIVSTKRKNLDDIKREYEEDRMKLLVNFKSER